MTLKRTLTDAVITLAVGVFTVVGTRGAAENADPTRRDLDPLAYVLVVIAAAGVIVWRRWPLATLAVSAGAGVVYLAREYAYGPVIAVMAFTMFNAAVRLQVRRSLPACGLAIAGLLAGGLIHVRDYTGALQLLASSAWFLVPWAIGTVVQGRREASARDREESRRRTAYEQRLSIARDVHDVVGHGLAVINMQAGIALHVLEKRPEQAAVALDAIKRTSKEALDELRTTLAVYRSTDPAPRSPAAGLGQLDALVASTGLDVSLKVTGEPGDVPTSVDLAAYRIVQESLTNVLRHAGEATVTVHIGHEPGALLVEVTDTGSGSPAHQPGHGIAGMRERAAAVGGTLEADPRAEGGFAVRARLPVGE